MAAPSRAKSGGQVRSPKERFIEGHRRIWNEAAQATGWGDYYHTRPAEIYRFLVSPHQSVLEIGCGRGDLLATVAPASGLGVDFAEKMIATARTRHPGLQFIESSIEEASIDETFDYIILSDVVNDLWDIRAVLERCHKWSHPRTRVIINLYSRLWQPALMTARKLSLARTTPVQSWVTTEDMTNCLRRAEFEVLRGWP